MKKETGCSQCPHAVFRFNGGNGATTCDLLGSKIVAYGHKVPTENPAECPLLSSVGTFFPVDIEALRTAFQNGVNKEVHSFWVVLQLVTYDCDETGNWLLTPKGKQMLGIL